MNKIDITQKIYDLDGGVLKQGEEKEEQTLYKMIKWIFKWIPGTPDKAQQQQQQDPQTMELSGILINLQIANKTDNILELTSEESVILKKRIKNSNLFEYVSAQLLTMIEGDPNPYHPDEMKKLVKERKEELAKCQTKPATKKAKPKNITKP